MTTEELINDIITVLVELGSDTSIPRNVKLKLTTVATILREPAEPSIKVDKALQELEEVTDDNNLQPHVRTQIWNIVSMLEKTA
ncbi:UPF0147 family protein [Candidatus Woesearchaeota archaeon]|nr:UPF0147 family protein [Candidatus Woesearchaeota archaeon]